MDDESRQRKLIQEQIERARREGEKRRQERAALEAGGAGGDAAVSQGDEGVPRELKRDEGEKVQLSLSFKTAAPAQAPESASPPTAVTDAATTAPSEEAGPSVGADSATEGVAAPASAPVAPIKSFIAPPPKAAIGFTPKPNAFKMSAAKPNPLKKSNPLKSSSSGNPSSASGTKRSAPMSAVEAIVAEEMAKKQRRMA